MGIKKFALTAGIGAGTMWLLDPDKGRRRRHEARESLNGLVESIRSKTGSGGTGPGPEMATPGRGADASAVASGADTLDSVLSAARDTGFASEFEPAGDNGLRCERCETIVDPAATTRFWVRRLEGASDPADMMSVSGLQCPSCGVRGVYVSPYGVNADDRSADISLRLPPCEIERPMATR